MNSAWVKRRRGRYFIGSYNETHWLTVIAPGPYHVLSRSPSPAELGSAVLAALEASSFDDVDADELARLADERALELAHAAGVSSWKTFERGTRLIGIDQVCDAEVLVTPNHRRRGYWEPMPERYWQRLRWPTDATLGEAVLAALEQSTA